MEPPQPGELRPRVEDQPGRADDPSGSLIADREHRGIGRRRRDPGDQVIGQPAPVFCPDLRLHRRDLAQVGLCRDLSYRDAVRQDGIGGHVAGHPDQHGLGVLGYEPGRTQPGHEIGGEVMTAGLPLHDLGPGGEEIPLPCDQRVEVRAGHAQIPRSGDEPAERAGHADHRTVSLDRDAGTSGVGEPAQLLVVGTQQDLVVDHAGDSKPWLTRLAGTA